VAFAAHGNNKSAVIRALAEKGSWHG
jgi:hypothetical protein